MHEVYHHLSMEERERIEMMRRDGRSMREMARVLGRSASTISRKLRRNRSAIYDSYVDHRAQERADKRREKAGQWSAGSPTRAYTSNGLESPFSNFHLICDICERFAAIAICGLFSSQPPCDLGRDGLAEDVGGYGSPPPIPLPYWVPYEMQ